MNAKSVVNYLSDRFLRQCHLFGMSRSGVHESKSDKIKNGILSVELKAFDLGHKAKSKIMSGYEYTKCGSTSVITKVSTKTIDGVHHVKDAVP